MILLLIALIALAVYFTLIGWGLGVVIVIVLALILLDRHQTAPARAVMRRGASRRGYVR